jgi:hypothetical protein
MATLRFGQKTLSTIQTVVMLSSFALLLLNQSMTSFIIASVLRGIASGCGVGIDTLATQVVAQKHVNQMVGRRRSFRRLPLCRRHLDKFIYFCRTATPIWPNRLQSFSRQASVSAEKHGVGV